MLQSPWVAAAVGALAYTLTTAMLLRPERMLANRPAPPVVEKAEPEAPVPSWAFRNPEVDQLVTELKAERQAVRAREKELDDLAARLATERQEIGTITQRVAVLQAEIDRAVIRIRDDENVNLKRLAKVYTTMGPEASAKIIAELQDEVAVKLFALMKESDTAPILEIISKTGPTAARRVAMITDRLRLLSSSSSNLSSSASAPASAAPSAPAQPPPSPPADRPRNP